MKTKSSPKRAIAEINRAGLLLVFPILNKKEPASLWSTFYPRSQMKWEWDSDGDNRVASLWHLMKELSDCREVIYSKWYQGRATFFSQDLFRALLKCVTLSRQPVFKISPMARQILDVLEMDSPLSTKELKKQLELQGKDNKATYERATKELFQSFLTVGYGEVDDGAFPSLALGATRLLYEDLWNEAQNLDLETASKIIEKFMPPQHLTRKFLDKLSH